MATTPALELFEVSVRFRATDVRHRTLKEALAHVLDRRRPDVVVALDRVSLIVREGESVGLVGRNGAGKSTLLRVMGQIIIPNQGRVVARRRVVPLLELGVGFHPEMTGRENCCLVGTLLGFSPAETAERLPRIAEFAELGEYMDRPMKYYSSGMWARLGLALVTEVEPEVLLMDEVLTVGDEFFQKRSEKRLDSLLGRGVATVIASHNLEYLTAHCRRLVWLDEGRVVADGPAAEVAQAYRDHEGRSAAASPATVPAACADEG